jgi:hypothetical protein
MSVQARDVAGRFDRMPRSAPEVTIGGPLPPGTQVALQGVPGYRVVETTGDTLTLRPPAGGFQMATTADVTVMVESPTEREANLRAEADVARLLVSVKKLSRHKREQMDQPTSPPAREALDALAMLYAEGRMGAARYLYAMTATRDAPVGANHAALALLMREHLPTVHYDALTASAKRAGAVLPE